MQPVYRSTDTGAPALSNTNGSLVAVLDAVLINGYAAKAGLGWSIAHTATNKRVYQQGAGSGFSLRVDDSLNVYNARVRGGESFSGIDTYSGGFPTAAQYADPGMYMQKTSNSAGDRSWVAWGDAKRFVIFVDVHGTGANWNAFFFGDFVSFKAGDAYACAIIGKDQTRTDSNSSHLGVVGQHLYANAVAHYVARGYTGAGSAVQLGTYSDGRNSGGRSGSGSPGAGVLVYPDPISGGLHLSRIFLSENASGYAPRGYLPGIWCINHDRAAMVAAGVANGDTFTGTDGLASRTYEFRLLDISNAAAALAIETSDWPESA